MEDSFKKTLEGRDKHVTWECVFRCITCFAEKVVVLFEAAFRDVTQRTLLFRGALRDMTK